jgi:large subunit ribosomal protein L4
VFTRSVRNLKGVEVLAMDEVEVYHVLKYKWCVLERGVVDGVSADAGRSVEFFSMEGVEEALLDEQAAALSQVA